ncbi:MAG: response regulator transcription factor [Anaerolineae bacterium]
MSIHIKLREILGVTQNPSALVQLRPDLLTAVEEIAAQHGRPIGEVANDLISHALYYHELAESSMQIWRQLTRREREVTALIWLGLTNPQIAQRLSISPNTVKTHIKSILTKFNVHSKQSLSDLLAGLDLSDWVGDGEPPSPTTAGSPGGVSP